MTTKILSLAALAEQAEEIRRRGQSLVLTNGCFDLLHVGHVRYLEQARALGDFLAVAVNGDRSVRKLKGDGRPVTPDEERAELIAALTAVDFVTIFPEERVTAVIQAVRPSIYTKGGDYSVESLNPEELAALRDVGAVVQILPLVPGKSTSAILERLCSPNE